jgi:hypothetical protein
VEPIIAVQLDDDLKQDSHDELKPTSHPHLEAVLTKVTADDEPAMTEPSKQQVPTGKPPTTPQPETEARTRHYSTRTDLAPTHDVQPLLKRLKKAEDVTIRRLYGACPDPKEFLPESPTRQVLASDVSHSSRKVLHRKALSRKKPSSDTPPPLSISTFDAWCINLKSRRMFATKSTNIFMNFHLFLTIVKRSKQSENIYFFT